jgi:hypothetical protein
VVGSRFRAHEPLYQGPLRSARLRDAWVEGVLDAQGSFAATASFLLQPGRATHCALRLPAGARLLQIVADEQPACRQRLPDGSWRVALGPPFLPRVIKVSYLAETENPYARVRLAPPDVLIGDAALPLPATDWKIDLADGMRLVDAQRGRRIAGAKFAENRYRQLASTLVDAAALALDSPEAEVRPWFAAWQEQIETLGVEANQWGVETSALDLHPEPAAESTTWSELVQRMEMAEGTVATLSSPYPPSIPRRPVSKLTSGAAYLTSDSAGQIEIVRGPLATTNLWRWVAALVILTGGLTLERLLPSQPDWIEGLGRWPHALAFGAGALWWWLLWPSVVGLLMMALAALSLAVEFRRRRRSRMLSNASTQLTARVS